MGPLIWMLYIANAPDRAYLDNVRRNKGPFTDEESFDTSGEGIAAMEQMRVLLVECIPRHVARSNLIAESC